MISDIKRIVPVPLLNFLRPYYRRFSKRAFASPLWPKPSDWRAAQEELNCERSLPGLYKIADREFGIIQNLTEIIPFLEMLKHSKPKIGGEIGMKKGGNSFLFMQAIEGLEKLIGLDIRITCELKLRFLLRPPLKLVCIEGDSHLPETAARVGKALAGKKFDFLFIDGDHSYEGIKKDYLDYQPLVREGGLVAFHDIVPDHFVRYGIPSGSCYAGGVHLFWKKIKRHYEHYEFIDDPDQNGFGIGVIVKKHDIDRSDC